jgi:23S rRNA (guanine2445-N2)-methyltransferase / 23S rRNA (guanine2069-N7)-methyltransferase
VHLRLDRGEAILSLDLSGHSLHQRGYRLQQGAAPLKENLAAAVLIRAGWPRIAAEGGALADPMCGVGTFLVEAAMIAADMAPNLKRERWGFTAWLGHVPALWRKLHDEAQARAQAGLAKPPLWIRGYEADPRLIQPGRNNVERAGLGEWIKIYQGEVATFEPRPDQNQKGLVICNPPYGERLGDEASLLYLYQNLGERLRQACMGWEAAVFTGAPELGKRMGIRSHKQYAFWNGALPCKLLLFKVQPDQFVTGERRPARLKAPSPPRRRRPASRRGCRKGRRCSPTACRRTSSNWASGPAARRSTATACTMPTCRNTPWRSTCTTTGCTCRNTPRQVHRPGKGPGALLDALAAIPRRWVSTAARGAQAPRAPERHAPVRAPGTEGRFRRSAKAASSCWSTSPTTSTPAVPRPPPDAHAHSARGRRQALPQPVLLHRHGHRARGQGRRAQHHQRRPVEDLPGLGAAQPVAERLLRRTAWSRAM